MKIFLNYAICLVIGYLFGSINIAYLISRQKGFDLRASGSGNSGASNALITMGAPVGIAVGAWDIGKSVVAVLIARYLFPALASAAAVAGVFCVIGHIFPYWMQFKGGKGFASFMGLALAIDWRVFIAIGAAVIVVTLVSDYIAVATAMTCFALPLAMGFFLQDWVSAAIVAVASLIILSKHMINFRRIARGEEIGLRKSLKAKKQIPEGGNRI